MKRLMKGRRIASLAALLAMAAVTAAAAWAALEPGTPGAGMIYLTWHAPFGMPGATTNLTMAPGDTTEHDTLYLT